MLRTVIILSDILSRGEEANVAAILMGSASLDNPALYSSEKLRDLDGNTHASIRHNVVILQGNLRTILSASQMANSKPSVYACLFSRRGQLSSNAYDTYALEIASRHLAELEPVGLLIVGDDQEVRPLTKKFSVLRG